MWTEIPLAALDWAFSAKSPLGAGGVYGRYGECETQICTHARRAMWGAWRCGGWWVTDDGRRSMYSIDEQRVGTGCLADKRAQSLNRCPAQSRSSFPYGLI